jgi:hypothetical protein
MGRGQNERHGFNKKIPSNAFNILSDGCDRLNARFIELGFVLLS